MKTKIKKHIDVNGDTISRIRKGSLVAQGPKSGKVSKIEKMETFGFILYYLYLEDGTLLKQIKSTL